MFGKTTILSLVLLLLLVVNCEAGKKRTKFVFVRESRRGHNQIKTYNEAKQICRQNGAVIAKLWQLRDAVRFRHFSHCGCGWIEKERNASPRCPGETAYYKLCDRSPPGNSGYNVYCFGKTRPEMPPDAVAINTDTDRGYVFPVMKGDLTPIPNESKAKSVCVGRQATLATNVQVSAAWFSGMSACVCAYIQGYQFRVMNDLLKSCGNMRRLQGCHQDKLYYALCFVPASKNPIGKSVIDFSKLRPGVSPVGVEEGAVRIKGGYVYPSMGIRGDMRTTSIFLAYTTCKDQGASLATPVQLREAMRAGMTWCTCGWVWENAELLYGVMVQGTGGVMYPTRRQNALCGQKTGLVRCPFENPTGEGWNVFCYRECPDHCPPSEAWLIPIHSVPITGGRVFPAMHPDGTYKLTSKWFANRECRRKYKNGVLATRDQIEEAVRNGMTHCRCGYIDEGRKGSVVYPMFRRIESCGNSTGVLTCPALTGVTVEDLPEQGPGWDSYCFIANQHLRL